MIQVLRLLLLLVVTAFGSLAAGQSAQAQSGVERPSATQQSSTFIYPVGLPGKTPGDGVYIRDGYLVENTWYNPGWWHTAEDWYAVEGSSVGLPVYAVADGDVVYAGANYPGRVVIIRHANGLYSMYGHLDPALKVKKGQRVAQGTVIGGIGPGWKRAPGHLHFEIRTFFTTRAVNGAAPRYRYKCGVNCPPGPGYWPIKAAAKPSEMGWRNPTHVIANRAGKVDQVLVVSQPVSPSLMLWSAPPGPDVVPEPLGEVTLRPGATLTWLETRAGAENTRETSALSYILWYRLRLPDGREGWAQAAVPYAKETGSDGRPAGVRFNFVPAKE